MKNNINLSLNLNAIALLRNRRNLPWPDIIELARIGLQAGATGITVHPRPDERHIKFTDIKLISNFLKSEFKNAIFNIEGYPSNEFLDLAIPYADQITLVPDSPKQNTSDHGWDLTKNIDILSQAIKKIKNEKNIVVSAFIEGNIYDLSLLKKINIDKIELYTGLYALYYNNLEKMNKELKTLEITAQSAKEQNLGINAGHDLTVYNIPKLLNNIPIIEEVSIGHGLIADALIYGMENTIKRFLKVLKR